MTDLQATLAAIDELAVDECGQCRRPLRPDGPSPDFCGAWCQEAWTRQHHEIRELVGYREPDDLPQHVFNLTELASPETTALTPISAALAEAYRNYRPRWFAGASPFAPGGVIHPVRCDSDMVPIWMPPPELDTEAVAAAFAGLREQMTRLGRDLAAGFRRAGETMAAVGLHVPPTEPDPRPPMEQAIEARRRRNTGPSRPDRVPRRIDPRRGTR